MSNDAVKDLVKGEQLYSETCLSIRETDDISFKLISLIPLLSGGSILTLLGTKLDRTSPVVLFLALFAGLTTLAIFRWELRNIQTCTWLRKRAERLEETVAGKAKLTQRPEPPSFFEPLVRRFPQLRVLDAGFGKTEAAKCVYSITVVAWLLFPAVPPHVALPGAYVVALALGLSTAVAPTFAFAANRPGGGGNHGGTHGGGMHSGASQHFSGAAGRYGGQNRQFAGGGHYGGAPYGGGGYYGGGYYGGGGGYYGCQANGPDVGLGILSSALPVGGYSYGYGNC